MVRLKLLLWAILTAKLSICWSLVEAAEVMVAQEMVEAGVLVAYYLGHL
jgi:hypothetical protein